MERMAGRAVHLLLVVGLAACASRGSAPPPGPGSYPGPEATVERLAAEVERGCKTELEEFCSLVQPGDQRLLACLYAYSDQLSATCEYALVDAASQLVREVSALSSLAHECDDDLERLCADVVEGGGRLVRCLDRHASALSGRCASALRQAQL